MTYCWNQRVCLTTNYYDNNIVVVDFPFLFSYFSSFFHQKIATTFFFSIFFYARLINLWSSTTITDRRILRISEACSTFILAEVVAPNGQIQMYLRPDQLLLLSSSRLWWWWVNRMHAARHFFGGFQKFYKQLIINTLLWHTS